MMRLPLPQELAATFCRARNLDIIGFLDGLSGNSSRNESLIAHVKTWKIRGICSRAVQVRA